MFGKEIGGSGTMSIVSDKIWCFLNKKYNIYMPIEKKKEFFYDTLNSLKKENSLDFLSIYADYDAGLITKEEMLEATNANGLWCFIQAKNLFKAKYNYFPFKVPKYELSAFEHIE